MRFSVLGLVSVSDGVETVVLPPSKPTSLLAALLLRPNQTVSAAYLQSVVWEASPPSTAKATLQTYVLRVRRLFAQFGANGSVIETVPGGYRFPATAATLDLVEFRELVADAAAAGDRRAELTLLRRALALWQGPPLANIASGPLQRDEVPCLTEEWLRAAERRFELELEMERHQEVTAELRAAVARHPGYERFWEQLIVSLYRSARQAEALKEYGNVKRHLREELGIDPGARLQQLELAILRGDVRTPRPAVTEVGSPVGADQLPPDPPHFTGREAELAAVRSWLTADRPAPLVLVSGAPGVGKTALAVHVAHAIRARFPTLRRLVPMRVPDGAGWEAWSAQVRRELVAKDPAGTLLVFDDVVNAAQLRPILAAGPGWAAIVTARSSLAGLAARRGGLLIRLGALESPASVRLLSTMLADEVAADRAALSSIAEACDHLPAALLIAASRLANDRPATAEAYAGWLRADPLERLRPASGQTPSMARLLDDYVSTVDENLIGAFLALAQAPAGGMSVADAANLLSLHPSQVEGVLEELLDASLLETRPGGGYVMYPLLRRLAAVRSAMCVAAGAGHLSGLNLIGDAR
jgi:DNA-binding SARP family transcriptional activator